MPRRNRHHAGAADDQTPALCMWSHGSTTLIAVDLSKTGPVTHGFEFDRTLTEALEEGVWSLPLSVAGELDLKKWNRRMKAHRYYVTASAVLLNALLDRRSDSVTEGLEQLQYSFFVINMKMRIVIALAEWGDSTFMLTVPMRRFLSDSPPAGYASGSTKIANADPAVRGRRAARSLFRYGGKDQVGFGYWTLLASCGVCPAAAFARAKLMAHEIAGSGEFTEEMTR